MRTCRVSHTVLALIATLVCTLLSAGAWASDDLDVTMRMVTDDKALTDSVVRNIKLNRPIMLDARPAPADTEAKEARKQGRAFGQSVAEQAREAARARKKDKTPGRPDNPGAGKPPGRPDSPGNSGKAPK